MRGRQVANSFFFKSAISSLVIIFGDLLLELYNRMPVERGKKMKDYHITEIEEMVYVGMSANPNGRGLGNR